MIAQHSHFTSGESEVDAELLPSDLAPCHDGRRDLEKHTSLLEVSIRFVHVVGIVSDILHLADGYRRRLVAISRTRWRWCSGVFGIPSCQPVG